MPPRSRYAVDPSLTAPAPLQPGELLSPRLQHQQQQLYQEPQLHNVTDRRSPAPTGPYAPSTLAQQQQAHPQYSSPPPQYQAQTMHPSLNQPTNHIQPPPHSSGQHTTGPRVKIDPSQMPNPIEAQEMDQNLWDDEDFMSCQTRGVIPLAGADWRGVDQGNSLPRHLRATLPTVPSNAQLLDTTALPFGLVIQPFAPLRYDEAPVPCVSSFITGTSAFDSANYSEQLSEEGGGGPPRCEKCRAYINPWIRWTDGGRKWSCNLCAHDNVVPESYFCHLSPNGQRLDHDLRPEMQNGTVDFAVPRTYWAPQPPPSGSLIDSAVDSTADALSHTASDLLSGLQSSLGQGVSRGPSPALNFKEREKQRKEEERRLRRPVPMGRVFIIDVSTRSVTAGILHAVVEGIRKAIFGSIVGKEGDQEEGADEEDDGIGAGEPIAIVTVAETVGFWNLTASSPSLMVVSDLDDMFVPMASGFLVDPVQSKVQIDALLDMLPSMMEANPDGNRCAAGAAIKGALSGLRSTGGQITLFLSGLPTLGPGKLQPRDDPTAINTDKERTLFTAGNPFWRVTADEAAELGVGINVFLFPDQYTDVASVGTLASTTGGEIFFHPRFNPVRDGDTLHDEIKRTVIRETAYNATVRVRCSDGLRVSDHIGNFYQRNLTDVEFGTIDDAKAFVATIKHEARLDDRQPAFVQVAVLYTSSSGERRVRCLNMSFTTTSLIGNVFRFADLDASVTVFFKWAISQMGSKPLKDIRKALTEKSNRVLLMYRRHCAPAVQAGQLILPEGFKLLPLYTLCMLKSKPLKGGNVTSDVRAFYMRAFRSMSVVGTMNVLYPRLVAIHDLSDSVGFPGPNGRLRLPRFMRASYGWMVAEGAYLMTNGELAMVWFGSGVSPQIVDDLYGVESIDELDVRITHLPRLPTLLSTQVRNILTHLEGIVGHSLPVVIVRQNLDGIEIEFANQLVEDSNNDAPSYTDYLMMAHKSITNDLNGSGAKEGWMPWS